MHKPTFIIYPPRNVVPYCTVQSISPLTSDLSHFASPVSSPFFAWTPDQTAQKTAEKARIPARLDSNPKDAPFVVKKKI